MIGWRYRGHLVHPVEVYDEDFRLWLRHFEGLFPAQAETMRGYSNEHGWHPYMADLLWFAACVRFLNAHAELVRH